jgi:hypothetical protein
VRRRKRESIEISLDAFPPIGQHLIQVATPGGLTSNEVLIFSE